jgi:GNAT superfamily N-acetyltransferase
MIEIRPARFPQQADDVRALMREYAAGLGIDLGFQDFDAELAGLPGKYAPPRGCVLLAWQDDAALGIVGLRPLDETVCEMKRLYVRPAGRGQQLGLRLAEAVVRVARDSGYAAMRLDTLPQMKAAQRIYTSLGFHPIPAYVFNPVEDALFLELDLRAP